MNAPDIDRVMHLVSYCPETGIFRWRNPTSNRVRRGAIAGCLNGDGYISLRLDGVLYKAHRIALYLNTGVWPEGDVDHIDGCRTNNAACNLRHASRAMNMENMRSARKDNRTQLLGVGISGSRFRSAIKASGRQVHLGCFDTAEAAHEAYKTAKRALHKGCTI